MNDPRPEPPNSDDLDPERLVEVGGAIGRMRVSLRFFGDDLEPVEITRLLGCEPTQALRVTLLIGFFLLPLSRSREVLSDTTNLSDVLAPRLWHRAVWFAALAAFLSVWLILPRLV